MTQSEMLTLIVKAKEFRGSKVEVCISYMKSKTNETYTFIGYTKGFSFKVGNETEKFSICARIKNESGKVYDKLPLQTVVNAIKNNEPVFIKRSPQLPH